MLGSYVRAAQGWTPVAAPSRWVDHRLLPVGPIHAADPATATSVCSGVALPVDVAGAAFEPWAPGTCQRCSDALAPVAATG